MSSKFLQTTSLILLLIASPSCVKEVEQESLHEVVFHAGWDAETKTVLQEDGRVFWSPSDEISVFVGRGINGGYKFTSTNTEDTSHADFVGQISGTSKGEYVAVYPFNTITFVSDHYIVTEIPSVQTATEGSFAKDCFVSVACSTNESLYFKNICGGIKFSVANEGINRIVINSNFGISGETHVRIDDNGIPHVIESKCSELTIEAPGDEFEVGKYYYAALTSKDEIQGYENMTVTYFAGDKAASLSLPLNSLKRGVFKRLYEADKDLQFRMHYDRVAFIGCNILPDDVDKTSITEAIFHINDPRVTERQIMREDFLISPGKFSEPIYFEQIGTAVHYYTNGQVYKWNDPNFDGWRSLRTLDLSMFDTSDAVDMSRTFMECTSLEQVNLSSFETGNVQNFDYMFGGCENLRELDISGFNTSQATTMRYMFSGLTVKQLDLSGFETSNVENMEAMFSGCYNLSSLDVSKFNTSHVTSMGGMFSGCKSLRILDLHSFDLSKTEIMSQMFKNCVNLKTVKFPNSTTDNLRMMHSMFEGCCALEHVDLSSLDTRNVEMMIDLFMNCRTLKSLDLSNFSTEKVYSFRRLFYGCRNLEHLDISSFKSTVLVDAEATFMNTRKLTTLDLGELDLHDKYNDSVGHWLGELSKECHIRCTEQTKNALIAASSLLTDNKYKWHTDGAALPDVSFEFEDDLYYSTDYSKDKTVRTVQLATEGAGIDIVLMGDAYSDRLIADGTYDRDMERAIDAIFTVEPFKSLKHLFNISIVYAVSENEVLGKSTALNCFDERPIGSEGWSWRSYYHSAAKNYSMGTIAPIILMHSDKPSDGAATGFISWTTGDYMNDPLRDDYHGGFSEAVAYILGQDNRFDYTVRHEFGHSFGFLMDEYVSTGEGFGGFDWEFCFAYGLWKNVDLVSDNSVKWAKFINDPRYAGTGIGVYEGAYLPTGMWRSSPNSIMNSTDCGFNAPSREAIYYRIHKLAYGKDWPYDYETFVQWDAPNIAADKAYFSARPAQLRTIATKSAKRPHLEMRDVVHPDGRKGKMIVMD